jgi:hypothetical protein
MNNPSAIIAPDLTKRPPRIPRSRLGGYALVPRMLDCKRRLKSAAGGTEWCGGRKVRHLQINSSAQQQFGGDETRFDGLAEADIVRDEEVHARQPQRLVERLQLIRVNADAGAERGLEEPGVGRGHAIPTDRIQERREVPRLVESLVADIFPSLLTRNEPIEFRLPHDIEFLALCIVVRTGERNERAVICGIHRLHKPVTRANTNDISLGWNCDGHAQTTRGSIADAIPRSTLTLPLVWGSTMRRGFQKRDLNASEFSSQEVPCGALESSRASQVSS